MAGDPATIADRLERLAENERLDAPWYMAKETHTHKDGTDHFTHVRFNTVTGRTVMVAEYVTPELGELLCTLHNNLPEIIAALRKCETSE